MTRIAHGVAAAVAIFAVAAGAHADDVNIQVTPREQPVAQPAPPPGPVTPRASTVIVPQGNPTAGVPPSSLTVVATLEVDEIEATNVQAGIIYANQIQATNVQGTVHQTRGVKIDGHGDIKAPTVTASVIFAEKIKADSVVADHIYVRDMKRK
jgi:hypothetical protein